MNENPAKVIDELNHDEENHFDKKNAVILMPEVFLDDKLNLNRVIILNGGLVSLSPKKLNLVI